MKIKPAIQVCVLITALAITTLVAVKAQPAESLGQLCSYDLDAMLSLDEQAFDQNPDGGWRQLAKIADCYPVVADLIRDYRLWNNSASTTLAWHEGQIRAYMEDYDQAIELFNLARHPNNLTGWNSYVDATIAFIRHDREALLLARTELMAVPRPEVKWLDADGNEIPVSWPPNLVVVDRLIRCFDESYAHAYGRCPEVP
jgi:hypothetical protein